MGLSGPRKRAKLCHDPNNTAWSRSTARFGQKLLVSSGWTPGSSLGVADAPYANNPASISHIRITANRDNLGLGARNSAHSDEAPTTGLDGLQHLLGRLNGKNEKLLKKEFGRREDTTRALYVERRWGFGSFVSGGFLVEDRLRAREDEPVESAAVAAATSAISLGSGADDDKKNKKKAKSEQKRETNPPVGTAELVLFTSSTANLNVRRLLVSNMERKAQRRAWKAEKQAARAPKRASRKALDLRSPVSEAEERALQVPEAGRTLERHAVRRRFIQHKKMSMTDGKALNELLGRGSGTGNGGLAVYPMPIATAAANAQAQQRRRLSITSLGLSGSPTQASAFARARQGSLSSGASNNTSLDENAIEEGDAAPMSSSPNTPFARRLSSGARALRDVRTGSGNTNGEGFNWSEQLRTRAKRSSSVTSPPTSAPAVSTRERQAATSAPPPVEIQAKAPPKAERVPDHFQERILKGDFYMD
ncbi:MAG: hypothetical protein Q9173_000825 [Seirophora scorigena]